MKGPKEFPEIRNNASSKRSNLLEIAVALVDPTIGSPIYSLMHGEQQGTFL
jgi:hypothetical protein